nr:immunoglobulin light chain junction region [Macaca mulatta]
DYYCQTWDTGIQVF